MTGPEMKAIREEIGYDLKHMAIALDNMPYRTYQDYERSQRKIPAKVVDKVKAVQQKDREFMTRFLPKFIEKEISRQFPMGIPSEACQTTLHTGGFTMKRGNQ